MVAVVNKTVCAPARSVSPRVDGAVPQTGAFSGVFGPEQLRGTNSWSLREPCPFATSAACTTSSEVAKVICSKAEKHPTVYLYDGRSAGANIIEEVDSNGNVVARYTQGKGVDQPFAELRSSTASYYEQDGLSSITSLTNSAGVLANTYTYDSFGKLTGFTGTLTNPFRYTGRENDSETGIYDYRARYYDQNVGRFINEDPIGFKGGIDFYTYVKNRSLNFTDPTGYCPTPCNVFCVRITMSGVFWCFDNGVGQMNVCSCPAGNGIFTSLPPCQDVFTCYLPCGYFTGPSA